MPFTEERNLKNLDGFGDVNNKGYGSGYTFTGRGTIQNLGRMIQNGYGKGLDGEDQEIYTKEDCTGSGYSFEQETLQRVFCGIIYYEEK